MLKKLHEIKVKAPTFYQKVILIPDWELQAMNKVTIEFNAYNRVYYLTDKLARLYPIHEIMTTKGVTVNMRAVPRHVLERLTTEGGLVDA